MPQAAVRAAHLACLDAATSLYSAPEAWVGPDLVALCATFRKHCSALLRPDACRPLHPDSAAELLYKGCALLQAALRSRQGVLSRAQRLALAAASLHVLLACGQLARHGASLATPALSARAASAARAGRPQSQAPAGACRTVAAECAAEVARLGVALLQAGVATPSQLSASGAVSAVRELLEGLVADATRADGNDALGGWEGAHAAIAAAAAADGLVLPESSELRLQEEGLHWRCCFWKCELAGGERDAAASMRRALVWAVALAMLLIQVGQLDAGGVLQLPISQR